MEQKRFTIECWTSEQLSSHVWCWRIMAWFIYLVYGFPVAFFMMASRWDVWPMFIWGGFATVFIYFASEKQYKRVNAERLRREDERWST